MAIDSLVSVPTRHAPAALVAGALAWLIGCTGQPAPAPVSPVPARIDALASKLATCNVGELATGLAMDPQVGEVWRVFHDAGDYASLVEDYQRPAHVRFAAALILHSESAGDFHKVHPQIVAQVFATALQQDLAGYAFPWGSLWAPGEPLGQLGQVFVDLGAPAEPVLGALLEDATPRSLYLGREIANDMAQRQYRVKDFAAFYLAQIAKVELPWELDLVHRDRAIDRLRMQFPMLPPPTPHPATIGWSVVGEHGVPQVRTSSASVRSVRPHVPPPAIRGTAD